MKKTILLLSTMLFCTANLFAKDGYTINVNISNANDSLVYLCNYFGVGKNVFKIDSAVVKKTGDSKITLKSEKKLTGGIYVLLFADRTMQFEFILQNGDDFSMSFDRKEPTKSVKFSGSKENDIFYEYQKALYDRNSEYGAIQAEYASAKNRADSGKVDTKMNKFHKSLGEYRKSFVAKYNNSLAGKIVNSMIEPEVPEKVPMLADGKTKDSTFGYRYYKQHYWDTYDFKDDRLVYTPMLDPKLEMYFTRLVVQTPDSFGKEVDRILAKCEEKSDNYKYVLWYTARQAENSKVMGMDEAFLYLVEKYYLQGKAYWLQDSDIKKYKEAAEKLSNNTIGKQAQEIAILDTKNMPISLRQLASQKDYTVVAFYDPTCGHCQKEIPRVDSVLRIMYKKGKKIQVFAINNSNEDEKWRNFIVDKKLNDFWIHAWDPQHTSRYRKDYNVYSNPIFYLIDREGKIIGKRLDHSNLEDFIQFYEKKIAAEKKAG